MRRARSGVGRPARAAKGPALTRQKLQTEITYLQHEIGSLKHSPAGKRKLSATGKHGKKRGLALAPGDADCCAAEAVAGLLWLALGIRASDDDVLELYFRTADDPDEGASILATLHAAATFGLAGARITSYESAGRDSNPQTPISGLRDASLGPATRRLIPIRPPALSLAILGTALPEGDHAVVATPDGWWSWGTLYPQSAFPGAVIEEAWSVRWAA